MKSGTVLRLHSAEPKDSHQIKELQVRSELHSVSKLQMWIHPDRMFHHWIISIRIDHGNEDWSLPDFWRIDLRDQRGRSLAISARFEPTKAASNSKTGNEDWSLRDSEGSILEVKCGKSLRVSAGFETINAFTSSKVNYPISKIRKEGFFFFLERSIPVLNIVAIVVDVTATGNKEKADQSMFYRSVRDVVYHAE